MQTRLLPIRYPAYAVALVGLMATAQTGAQQARTGTVKAMQGEVSVVRADGSQPALPGFGLMERDRVVTGPASAATIGLRDGTRITVGPGSTVDLSSFQFEPTKQEGSMVLALLKGSVRFVTGILGKRNPDSVRISTSTATVGIRGTDFILEAP